MIRNFMVSLLLSQGVPMIRAGDEYGGTQRGNNNAYCQDNEISWLAWLRDAHAQRLTEFTCGLIHLRLRHPILHMPKFFKGCDPSGIGVNDINWLNTNGSEMDEKMWQAHSAKAFGVMLCGDSLALRDFYGEPVRDDTFLIYFNADSQDVAVILPGKGENQVRWRHIINTAEETGFIEGHPTFSAGEKHPLLAHSVAIYVQSEGTDTDVRFLRRRTMKKAKL
jgi:glycogen operon protein